MAFKDIVVHVDATESAKKRVSYAVAFAAAHEAHLTAIGFAATSLLPYYGEPGIVPPMPATYFERIETETLKALTDFEKRAERAGISHETRLLKGLPSDFQHQFAIAVRHADLAILGQPEEGDSWGAYGELITQVLYATGRPALIVPYIGAKEAVPQTVFAAWDGSAEAARAFHDAMPILTMAEKVVVFVGEPAERPDVHGDEPGADMARHLARHGVTAEVRRAHGEDIDVGDMLLSRVADEGADMIVMGAFHHSRLRESLLGGVTRTIIEHMTVPAFMAH